MEYKGPEKRRYKRMRRSFTARIRVYKGAVKPAESSKWDIVTIRNLSAAGISFNYNKKIALGALVELNITLPINPKPIRCLGQVCRIDETKSAQSDRIQIPIFGIAVRFIEIESDKKEAINKLVSKSS